jgi:hypothetical protein
MATVYGSIYVYVENLLANTENLLRALPRMPVTSDKAPSTVPVTSPTELLNVEPKVDTVLSTAPNAPSVEEPLTAVDGPEPHNDDDVDELETLLPLKPTSQAAGGTGSAATK